MAVPSLAGTGAGSFLQKGIAIVTEATKLDGEGNFPEALKKYQLALEYFMTAMKYERNEKVRNTLHERSKLYIDRAETIKKFLLAEKSKNKKDEVQKTANKRVATPNSPQRTMSAAELMVFLEGELNKLIGLPLVKKNLRELLQKLLIDVERKKRGLPSIPERLDMVFLGNPDTGKTKIGILLGKIFFHLGIIKRSDVTVVQRGDLVAGYIGHTANRTSEKIKEAKGGIFFLDEAYRLSDMGSEKDFGKEAIDEIMKYMGESRTSDDGVIFIFAGYSEQMAKFLDTNPGFKRRVGFTFEFEDYTCEEIAEIALRKIQSHGFKVESKLDVKQLASLLEAHTTEHTRSVMNGGLAEALTERANRALSSRVTVDSSNDELITITGADCVRALCEISQNFKD